jgi:hypothetical protein
MQMQHEAQQRRREEASSLAAPHQRSGAPPAGTLPPDAVPAPARLNGAHASMDDRPRRHTAPFTGGLRTSRRNTWEALDPDTGGERGIHDASQPPQCLQPQLIPLPTATTNGSHRSGPCLIRSGSATTELCDLQRQRSDPQSLGRAGSLMRHVSDQVTPVPDLCYLPLRNVQWADAVPCFCVVLQH